MMTWVVRQRLSMVVLHIGNVISFVRRYFWFHSQVSPWRLIKLIQNVFILTQSHGILLRHYSSFPSIIWLKCNFRILRFGVWWNYRVSSAEEGVSLFHRVLLHWRSRACYWIVIPMHQASVFSVSLDSTGVVVCEMSRLRLFHCFVESWGVDF